METLLSESPFALRKIRRLTEQRAAFLLRLVSNVGEILLNRAVNRLFSPPRPLVSRTSFLQRSAPLIKLYFIAWPLGLWIFFSLGTPFSHHIGSLGTIRCLRPPILESLLKRCSIETTTVTNGRVSNVCIFMFPLAPTHRRAHRQLG